MSSDVCKIEVSKGWARDPGAVAFRRVVAGASLGPMGQSIYISTDRQAARASEVGRVRRGRGGREGGGAGRAGATVLRVLHRGPPPPICSEPVNRYIPGKAVTSPIGFLSVK